jgi:hypothetical protein
VIRNLLDYSSPVVCRLEKRREANCNVIPTQSFPRSRLKTTFGIAFILIGTMVSGFHLQPISAPVSGSMSVYQVPSCIQPPAQVSPDTLADSQITAYGLPPRPEDPNQLPMWRLAIAHAKVRGCIAIIDTTGLRGKKHTSQWSNNHWAGNMARGGGYSYVYTVFNLHCVTNGGYAAIWTGLGAYPQNSNDNIIQSGANIYGDGTYDLWLENYPQDNIYPSQFGSSFHPTCGDTIYAADAIVNGYAYMDVADWSQNYYFSQVPSGYSLAPGTASKSADWIVEGDPGDGLALANFGSEYLVSDYAEQNGNWHDVASLWHDYAVMCNYSWAWWDACGVGSTEEAHPGAIGATGDSFPVIWDHS